VRVLAAVSATTPPPPPPADVLARCTVFHDLGDFIEVFNDAWTKVKGP